MIFLPKKINVGFQNRSGTYSGKLGYVIYYDETGKLRKETSWQNWRDKNIPNEEFDNIPTEGFVLNKNAGGVENSWGHNARLSYIRVYDPRGFEIEITIPNMLYILQNCDCIKGKGLVGEFVYGWDGTDLILVPTSSPDYAELVQKSQILQHNEGIKAKDLIVGATYRSFEGGTYVYMGRFKPYMPNYTTGWDDYYNGVAVYEQKTKYYYFFVWLNDPNSSDAWNRNHNELVYFSQLSAKFLCEKIADTTDKYPEYVDLLNHSSRISPVDINATKKFNLPYENFEAAACKFIEEPTAYYREFKFCVDEGPRFINDVAISYDYDKQKWFRYRTHYSEPKIYYDSLKQVYDTFKPVYSITYLANGIECWRSGYYDK